MKRIYIEFFSSLVLFLVLVAVSYDSIVYRWSTDHEYLLEQREAEAYQMLLDVIAINQGEESAISAVYDYAKSTANILTIHELDQLTDGVRELFLADRSKRIHHAQDAYWFKIGNGQSIYRLSEDREATIRQEIYYEDMLVPLFYLVGFLSYCLILVWLLSRRVRALEAATLDFANGDFSARALTDNSIRLGTLNHSFNHMAETIATLLTSKKLLTNAVAHELRTPIFRIQWQAEILNETSLSEDQRKSVHSIIEDTEQLEEMVDELLYYARAEHQPPDLNLTPLEINDWLSTRLTRWRDQYGDHDQSAGISLISTLLTEEQYLIFDGVLIQRVLDNLVQNAIKFAHSVVRISLEQAPEHVTIVVEDDGVGIDEAHWPYLFDAFYCVDKSREKKQSGYGLGLAIVKQIADRHGAKISVQLSQLGGACFRLSINK